MRLAIEAQSAIGMRLIRMSWGGAEAQFGAQPMSTETVDAAIAAAGTLMTGRSMEAARIVANRSLRGSAAERRSSDGMLCWQGWVRRRRF